MRNKGECESERGQTVRKRLSEKEPTRSVYSKKWYDKNTLAILKCSSFQTAWAQFIKYLL